MASNFRRHAVVFIIIGIFFLPSAPSSIPTEELDSMLDTLRIRGYELFCNAIVTSDLQFELLSGQNNTRSLRSYTFFAPIDSSLFSLDMTLTASSYIDTLRFHIVPRRLSITNLLRLPPGTSLPTLLSRRYLNVTQSPGSVSVGGVYVAFPGLFYGRHVAVHGLNGIISLRSSAATGTVSGSPVGFRNRRSSPSRSGSSSSESHLAMAPSPTSRPPGENIPPANRKSHAPPREPSDANSHFHAASPFHQAVHPPEPDEPNSPDNLIIHAPENSHTHADLLFKRAVDPPQSDEPNPPDNIMILAPETSQSPASTTESPANIYVLPPVVSHSPTPTSESPGYRHSSISAPPLEYSDMEVPTAMSPGVWLPNKHGVALIETFKGDSDELIEMGHFADEVPKMPQPLIDAKEMPENYEPLDGAGHCVDPDVGLGLQQSTDQCTASRYVCG